jgi:signal transduction histidine kinase
MNYFAISALVNLITSSVLFITMMSKSGRTKYDNWFAGFCFGTMVWSLGYFFWQISGTESSAIFWTRFLMSGATIVGLTYLQFVLSYLNKKTFRVVDALFALFFFLSFGPWIVKTVEPRGGFQFWPVPGYVFHVFLAIWIFSVLYSTYSLYRSFIVSEGLRRRQIGLLFFGMAIAFISGSTNYFLWYGINIPPYANVVVTIYPALIFYAILRYRFFNIKVFATQIFTLMLVSLSVWQYFAGRANLYVMVGSMVLVVAAAIMLIRSVIREVKQREQLEDLTDQLVAANDQLKTLDKARAEFISIASHQLRTPPSTIKWYLAAILAGDYGKLPKKVREVVEKAQSTNNSQISLIGDMLNASRIERGKMEFMFEQTDFLKIVDDAVAQLVPQAHMKKLELDFQKPGYKMPTILADKEKLQQVVNNLIDNAIKYTKQGSVTVTVAKNSTDIILKVRDTGKGILPGEEKNIFQKYGRGEGSQKHAAGLGLGLYVAKVVIDFHKGKIWAESAGAEKGSTFIVTLPIRSDLKADVYDMTKTQTP